MVTSSHSGLPRGERPFSPMPFAALPDKPRVPHGHWATEGRKVSMDSRPFGPVEIHYRQLGSGPPLLLVHGLMTTSYSWRYVVEPLSKVFRVVVPDLPGCGRSDKPLECSYHAEALAEWLVEFQDALSIRGCAAVGNSMGGYICMRAALREPTAFSRLMNVHSPATALPRFRALEAGFYVPGARSGLSWVIRKFPYRWVHQNVHYYDETLKSLEEMREYGDPLATAHGAEALVKFLAETMTARGLLQFTQILLLRRDRGEAFPVPLRLVYSRRDPIVPPSVGPELHALVPSAEFVWLDDTSHFAHVDSPEKIVRQVTEFFG